jgi:hypothetical protein
MVVHLAALYYYPAWNPVACREVRRDPGELCAADTWVIDGNYSSTLPIRLRRAIHVISSTFPRGLACAVSRSGAGATAAPA